MNFLIIQFTTYPIFALFNNQAIRFRDFVRLHFVDSAIPGVADVSRRTKALWEIFHSRR